LSLRIADCGLRNADSPISNPQSAIRNEECPVWGWPSFYRDGANAQALTIQGMENVGIDVARMQRDPGYAKEMQEQIKKMSPQEQMAFVQKMTPAAASGVAAGRQGDGGRDPGGGRGGRSRQGLDRGAAGPNQDPHRASGLVNAGVERLFWASANR
jgi:hypothetical protein